MASAEFTVNSLAVPPEVAVSASSTVNLALVSTTGVRSIEWSIIGNHSEAAVNPTITPAGSPSGATASFAMPSGSSQGYIVQCQINGGVDENGQAVTDYTKTALVGVVNAIGEVAFAAGETFERSATHGTTEALNNLANGVGGTGYTTVQDEGSNLTQRTTINFVGAGVTAADSGGKTVVTIAGSSGGSGGGRSFRFTYSTTTTDADPGAGTLRANNATLASATKLYIDLAEYLTTDITAWLDSLDDYVGAVKGIFRLQSISDPTKWIEYTMSAWTTAAGYRKFDVAYLAGPGGLTTTAGDTQLSWDGDPSVAVDGASLTNTAGVFSRAALTGDVTASAGSNTTAIAAGVIVDADVNNTAGLTWTKMAAASKGQSPVFGSAWSFFGVATKATDLTDANATVTVADGNRMVLPAATLSTTRNLTLGITGSPTDKELITVERYDTTANTYVVKSNGGSTLYTFPVSVKRMATFQYQSASSDWILVSHVAITS